MNTDSASPAARGARPRHRGLPCGGCLSKPEREAHRPRGDRGKFPRRFSRRAVLALEDRGRMGREHSGKRRGCRSRGGRAAAAATTSSGQRSSPLHRIREEGCHRRADGGDNIRLPWSRECLRRLDAQQQQLKRWAGEGAVAPLAGQTACARLPPGGPACCRAQLG